MTRFGLGMAESGMLDGRAQCDAPAQGISQYVGRSYAEVTNQSGNVLPE